jgi:hypothetical protein
MKKSLYFSAFYVIVFCFLFSINALLPEGSHTYIGIALIAEYAILIHLSYRFNPKPICFVISYCLMMLIFFFKHLTDTNPDQVNGISIFDTFSFVTIGFSIVFILAPLAIGKLIAVCKSKFSKSEISH